MAYDRDSFLAGVAVGRNMLGWPEMHGIGKEFFAFTIKIETAPFDYRFTVDIRHTTIIWGDGTSDEVNTPGTPLVEHTYNSTGIYQVKLLGTFEDVCFGGLAFSLTESAKQLISVDTPFPVPYNTLSLASLGDLFNGCENLEHIPDNLFVNIAASGFRVQSLYMAFYNCRKLAKIPKKLFKGLNISATDIRYLFANCISLTTLPEDLFGNSSFLNVRDVSGLFSSCLALERIPFDLPFSSATNAGGIFSDCDSLREVPETLFSKCTNLQTVNGCFSSSGIESIPGNLFSQNTQLKDVSLAFGSTPIQSVPSGLFNNLPLLEDASSCFGNCNQLITIQDAPFYGCPNLYDLEQCFYNCYRLQSVPSSLFNGLPSYAVFRECFDSCRAITSPVPELWEQYTTSRRNYCFYGCTNAANYSDIPSNWR